MKLSMLWDRAVVAVGVVAMVALVGGVAFRAGGYALGSLRGSARETAKADLVPKPPLLVDREVSAVPSSSAVASGQANASAGQWLRVQVLRGKGETVSELTARLKAARVDYFLTGSPAVAQVGAFHLRAEARAMVSDLATRGIDARVH